ncbi:MAG: alpha/beta hydrolase [Actinomycetota bacterium]|nr:alpha/beta hydrolase [Actinomycetota bacterium]
MAIYRGRPLRGGRSGRDTTDAVRPGQVLPCIDIGSGDPVVIMQGFALQPRTYRAVADLLAERCRVIIPPLFAEPGRHWSPDLVLADVAATLDHLGLGAVTMIGHSFGGGLELSFAVHYPERITELVFADTLAMAHEWSLAAEAVRPAAVAWMATPRAAIDFTTSFLTHPLCLAQAGWWGFRSDRHRQVAAVAASDIPCHVLWADRDSLLARSDGAAFARDLGADFTVVHGRSRHPVDHDWVYRHPHLVMEHLDRLGLQALRSTDAADRRR